MIRQIFDSERSQQPGEPRVSDFKIVLEEGGEITVNAALSDVEEGHLYLLDDKDDVAAVFAPGVWRSCVKA